MAEMVTSEPLSAFLERIEAPVLWTLQLEEAERQAVLLALHTLRQEKPGWDYIFRDIEVKLGGQLAWPEDYRDIGLEICFRCKAPTPGSQLVTTGTGGRYCLSCLPAVEICRGCGCTDEVACPGGCSWASKGICSTCEGSVE